MVIGHEEEGRTMTPCSSIKKINGDSTSSLISSVVVRSIMSLSNSSLLFYYFHIIIANISKSPHLFSIII